MDENEQEKTEKELNQQIIEHTKEYKRDKKKTNTVIYIFICVVLVILLLIVGKLIFSLFIGEEKIEDSECCENEQVHIEDYQIIDVGYFKYEENIEFVENSNKLQKLSKDNFVFLNTYEEYIKFAEYFNNYQIFKDTKSIKFTEAFFETNKIIAVKVFANGGVPGLKRVERFGTRVNIVIVRPIYETLGTCDFMLVIPIDRYISDAEIKYEQIDDERQKKDDSNFWDFLDRSDYEDKPIIYLYPTEETKVNVKLGYKDKITCSYPKYINEWNVLAKPDGNLKDLDTDKNLYALYYESQRATEAKIEEDGFVVKGEDSASFLEEKLKILGLNERETEEFIVYWLPKLEANKYNYIRFETKEEIEKNMPLEINPNPDTLIRVLMDFKGLEEKIKVKEQQLEPASRKGFVAVEWGGTEIK